MQKDDDLTSAMRLFVLTGIRVILGFFWISQFTWKPPPTFGCPNEGFCLWLDKEIQYPAIPLYGTIVGAVIRPNAIAVGWLSFVVETLIGVSLLLGVLTRLGGLIGALWSLNLLVGLAGIPKSAEGEAAWYYISLILLDLLYFAIGGSGQLAVDRSGRSRLWWARAA